MTSQPDGTGAGQDGGGPGGGGDSAGDSGPGLGQFRHALVSVEQSDGVVVGEAETDDTTGMVKFVLCGFTGPVRFTVKGKADGSTQYYDESTRVFVPFPANEQVNVVIPRFDKNVGITVLTEAAWQYMQARFGANGWRTAANVTTANNAIANEINRFLPKAMQITDITRLPNLIGATTPSGSIPATSNGIYGIVNSGLARAAGLLRVGDAQAALKLARQIGADLCDSVLDGACNGTPVSTDPSDLTYLVPQFGEFLNAGVGDVATGCGNTALKDSSLRIVQIKMDPRFPRRAPGFEEYTDTSPLFLLRNDGKVFFWATRASAPVPYAQDLTFRQLFPQGDLLGVTIDGRAFFAPLEAVDPTVPFGTEISRALPPEERPAFSGTSTVAKIDATPGSGSDQLSRLADGRPYRGLANNPAPTAVNLPNTVSVGVSAGTESAFFAVTADGRGWAWGLNEQGALGIGLPGTDIFAPNSRQVDPAEIPIPGRPPLVAIAGHIHGAYAITRAGDVWGWGLQAPVQLGRGNTPAPATAFDPFKPIRQIQCTNTSHCAAVTASGKMLIVTTSGTINDIPLPANAKAVFVAASARSIAYGVLDTGTAVLFPNGSTSNPIFVEPTQITQSTSNTCSGPRV